MADEDFYLFLDGGSGLVKRGFDLGQTPVKKHFHVLITHTHLDHILGLPLFLPLHHAQNHFTFYASSTPKTNFERLFQSLHGAANLPVPIHARRASISFKTVAANATFQLGHRVQVETFQLNHQGITLGYKVSSGKDSAAVITDHAPIKGNYLGEGMAEKARPNPEAFDNAYEASMVQFLKDVHTVVFDTHFTQATSKPDWGHSTPEDALSLCTKAQVKRLVLFHHAPEDDDRDVDDKVQSIFHRASQVGIQLEAAKEGDEWTLSA